MTITPEQLKALQPGDEVTLEIGWRPSLRVVAHDKGGGVRVCFEGGYADYFYYSYLDQGRYSPLGKNPLDIIAIHPKPFDWKDVKPGMAFRCKEVAKTAKVYIYIGPYFGAATDLRIFWDPYEGTYGPKGTYLDRAPERDLEWPDA